MKDDSPAEFWPESGLEVLGACPVCGGKPRHLLLEGLTDDAFRCAPGKWTLWRCDGCTNAYLDPRPNIESIGMAYSSYYTHAGEAARDDFSDLSFLRKLRRLASNGYTNRRYGTKYEPSSHWLGLVLGLLPGARRGLDVLHRWMPKPNNGEKLLDVGCGNGGFLRTAGNCGWDAHGADPDLHAIREAREHAVDARVGGIEAYSDMRQEFRAITFNHSIEHVHHPVSVIRNAAALLKDKGILYMETPNIDSFGRTWFGRHWRGLEVPRHLVIFSPNGIAKLLAAEGFRDIEFIRRTGVAVVMFRASSLIEAGLSPYEEPSKEVVWRSRLAGLIAGLMPTSRLEFIAVIARRGTT